ncbi:ATP-binding protein [uncultured Sphaerochaeta sp.]|uniref:sensor histidine kinase n=1 Tax=uncultured Sphaerochaeta sp. TaxID=886478 RepID=UPI002A0A4492|nr:ATP-binding protein [uncultured Sphaerochaeta sp.]
MRKIEQDNQGYQTTYQKTIACIVSLFLLIALTLFILKYGISSRTAQQTPEFYRTFFVFFFIATFCIVSLVYTTRLISIILLSLLLLMFLLVLDYSLNDYLTIRLWLYLAFQVAWTNHFEWPASLAGALSFTLAGTLLQKVPQFLGENSISQGLLPITLSQQIGFFFILGIAGIAQAYIRKLFDNWTKALLQIQVLNTTITKLTVFSQSLQSYARTVELQATKKERFRISREIHDISGYMFTNIIALMDAIISTGCKSSEQTSEMCFATRNQAQEGLVETRKALHLLRNTEDEENQGMKAIFKIKTVFEKTTGVVVDIETGNLPACFGDEVDLILCRVVQEGLTNALRHGHASHVRILFWIKEQRVQVIVIDNGSGAKKIIKGIGLAGMEERISKMQGTVKAINAPEGGFQLTVTIPLEQTTQGEYSDDQDIASR